MMILLFDIDGTLINSGGAGGAALNEAFRCEFDVDEPAEVPFAGRTDRGIGSDLFREHGIEDSVENWLRLRDGYLQRLPVDYIKIDGCFVRDLVNNPVDQKMVRLIGEIGEEAGMRTIAEYVQGGPTLAVLAELGIDLAQGFFIGRPTSVPTTKSMPIPINLKNHQASQKKAGSGDKAS